MSTCFACVDLLNNFFFFSSRRRHTRCSRDWSSDVCSSDLSPPSDSYVPESSASLGNQLLQVIRVDRAAEGVLVARSEEHTSELQSRLHLVCRLLLEKKKTRHTRDWPTTLPTRPAMLRTGTT